MNLAATASAPGAQPSAAGAGSGSTVAGVTTRNGERSARGDQDEGQSEGQAFDVALGEANEVQPVRTTVLTAGKAASAAPEAGESLDELQSALSDALIQTVSEGETHVAARAIASAKEPMPNAVIGGTAAAFRKAIVAREVQASLLGASSDGGVPTRIAAPESKAASATAELTRAAEPGKTDRSDGAVVTPDLAALASLLATSSVATSAPAPQASAGNVASGNITAASPAKTVPAGSEPAPALPGAVQSGAAALAIGADGQADYAARLVMVEVVGRETHLAPVGSTEKALAEATMRNANAGFTSSGQPSPVGAIGAAVAAGTVGAARPAGTASSSGAAVSANQMGATAPSNSVRPESVPASGRVAAGVEAAKTNEVQPARVDVAAEERVASAGQADVRKDKEHTVASQIAVPLTAAARELVANGRDTGGAASPNGAPQSTPSSNPAGAAQSPKDLGSPARTLILGLQPEDLGRVVVRLHLSGGALRVSVVAERAEAQARLREDRDALRDTLRAQGLTIEALTVESPQSSGAAPMAANDVPDMPTTGSAVFTAGDQSSGGGSREPAGDDRGSRRSSDAADQQRSGAAHTEPAQGPAAPSGSVYL